MKSTHPNVSSESLAEAVVLGMLDCEEMMGLSKQQLVEIICSLRGKTLYVEPTIPPAKP